MTINNGCCCFATHQTPCYNPTCPDDKHCIRGVHILVSGEDSLYCGETGFLNWADTKVSTTACDSSTPVFSIISHSDNLENVTANATKVDFTVKSGITDFEANITYQIACGTLSTQATITILVRNKCLGVNCGVGTVCNPCTGLCEAQLPDLSTETPESGIDLSTTP